MAKHERSKINHEISPSRTRNTPIKGHRQIGKKLVPPLAQIPGLQDNSWINDRLPEMLWATLITFSFDRDSALGQFRRIIRFVSEHEPLDMYHDLTLSGIGRLDDKYRNEIIAVITEPFEVAEALSPPRFFESLPARDTWIKYLPIIEPDLGLLMGAVGASLWHQSQNASDCRWMRLMPKFIAKKIVMPPHMANRLYIYPGDVGDGRIEGFVRAMEISMPLDNSPDIIWSNDFWNECWTKTGCIKTKRIYSQTIIDNVLTYESLNEVYSDLLIHWKQSHKTTATDARHDAVFGMGFYSLRILEEMMGIANGTSILGRLGLRTILEIRINLKYLLDNDDASLWEKWRKFGAGQAKLNVMKFRESIEPPEYIDIDSIEMIASEDMWEELVTVELSGWSGLDLRRMSERSGLKDAYDKYYSWTSGYAHGMWGAIRESSYQICSNPLHRLHRYPGKLSLQDTVNDAAGLVDEILQLVSDAYPTFYARLL